MSASNNGGEMYTKICPGGGLILAWQLKDKKVLLVGGGNVAAGTCLMEGEGTALRWKRAAAPAQHGISA